MESSLHRNLKQRYAPFDVGRVEVRVGNYRVDAIDDEGRLVEIQFGPLAALQAKLTHLLQMHECLVIKPIVLARRIVRRETPEGPDLSSRKSPYRGELIDVFDDLIGLARLFPHPNLTIDVVGVSVEEIRVESTKRGRRRSTHRVVDRRLVDILSETRLTTGDELWSLLPVGLDATEFTTLDCARKLGRSEAFAQRVAYCLRHAGAVEQRGFRNRRRIYARQSVITSTSMRITP